MICIYHNRDLDGYTSGAIVKHWHDSINDYPDNISKGNCYLIGFDYGQKLMLGTLADELHLHTVIMVDVSMKMPEMFALANKCKNFTWIDHHKSAIMEYEAAKADAPENFNAVLQDGIATCEVAWKYLFPNVKIPIAVKLLGEYDTWRNEDKAHWENTVLPFQFGMRLHCNSPETFPASTFLRPMNFIGNPYIAKVTESGITILEYQAQINATQCKKAAFAFTLPNGFAGNLFEWWWF